MEILQIRERAQLAIQAGDRFCPHCGLGLASIVVLCDMALAAYRVSCTMADDTERKANLNELEKLLNELHKTP